MKISGIVLIAALMILVPVSICPILAEDVNSNGPVSGQSGPYGAGSADSPLIRGPSSSDVYSRPAANSTVYPPTLYPPTAYPPNSYPPRSYPPASYPPALAGPQYQNLSGPANTGCAPPDITMPALGNRLIESTWYTRVDYFNWNEHLPGSDDVNEYGTLLTFGYMRRVGIERFHAAVFGATMRYKGYGQFEIDDSGNYYTEPLSSATGYLGVFAEYDLHIEPDCCPNLSFFAGVGTRFWIRDLKDGVTDYGNPSWGYQEFWWTFYPYIGLEKKRSLDGNWEFYYAGRIGCTAMTYQYAAWGGVPL
ncbi:MAG: hypothetical protein ABSE63_08790, partial [Thermoguttaceae bacterium]